MLKIKKILGILLALCFVMSVTAATVGATPNAVNKDVKKFDNDNKQVTKPVTKPVTTVVKKPVTTVVKKPVTTVVKKPVTTVVKKPVTKPAPEPRP